jgi:hypothetical protein
MTCQTNTDCQNCELSNTAACVNKYNMNHPNSVVLNSVKWMGDNKFIATAELKLNQHKNTVPNIITIHGKKTMYSEKSNLLGKSKNIKDKLFDEKEEFSIYGHASIPKCNKVMFIQIEKIKSEKSARFRGIISMPPQQNDVKGRISEYGGTIENNIANFYEIK